MKTGMLGTPGEAMRIRTKIARATLLPATALGSVVAACIGAPQARAQFVCFGLTPNNGVLLGAGAEAAGDGSMACGTFANATGVFATATGTFATATGFAASAAGGDSLAQGTFADAPGVGSLADGRNATAIGGGRTPHREHPPGRRQGGPPPSTRRHTPRPRERP